MRLASHSRRRPGFTLVEVIVAAGLCMLIMSVLAGAFAAGIDTFSLLKSTGELNDRLAVAKHSLLADLREVHLEDDTGLPLRVSNVRYDLMNDPRRFDATLGRYAKPPARGFFRIYQGGASISEGLDPDGIPSSYATNHVLHMSLRRTPDQASKVYLARVPHALAPTALGNPGPPSPTHNTMSNPIDAWTSDGKGLLGPTNEYPAPLPATQGRRVGDFGYRLQHECLGSLSGVQIPVSPLDRPAPATDRSFASPWAEVAYFLRDSGTTTSGPTPRTLYSLHRRARLLTKNDANLHQLNWSSFQTAAPGMSCAPGAGIKFLNGPGDIANPSNRMGGLIGTRSAIATGGSIDTIGPVADSAGNMTGEDILLTNVVSFEIKAAWDSGTWVIAEGAPLATLPVASPSLAEFPFDDLPLIPSVTTAFTQMTGGTIPQTITFPSGSGNSGDLIPPHATNNFARTIGGTARVFDTWSFAGNLSTWDRPIINGSSPTERYANPNCVPLPIRLKAIQIKLRIYDPKNKLTRQITIVQDL